MCTLYALPPLIHPFISSSPPPLYSSSWLTSLIFPYPQPPFIVSRLLLPLLPLLHWPGRSVSLSSSPPPPPASACGPSRREASSRPPPASCAPPPTSAAEPAPPSPGSVGGEEKGEQMERRAEKRTGAKGSGGYVNGRQILQYKVSDYQRRLGRTRVPIQGFVKYIPMV